MIQIAEGLQKVEVLENRVLVLEKQNKALNDMIILLENKKLILTERLNIERENFQESLDKLTIEMNSIIRENRISLLDRFYYILIGIGIRSLI